MDGVFDLENRRHLGHYQWDGVYPALMVLDGDLAVSSVELDGEMVPRLVVIIWCRIRARRNGCLAGRLRAVMSFVLRP